MTTATSVAQFYQDTSAFSGTGLLMNFGNGGGSFTGNFADFQVAGNSKFTISAGGTTTIGQTGQTITQAGLQVVNGGICVDNDGNCTASTSGRVSAVSYTTGSTDLAENYFSSTTLAAGNIVMTDGGAQVTLAMNTKKVLGVISTKPGVILGLGNDGLLPGQYPVALSGRVPVSVNLENGPIHTGDRITLSRSAPGVGARATATSSVTVGIALEDWSGNSGVMDTMATGTVLAFVSLSSRDLSDHVVGSEIDLTSTSTGEAMPLFALGSDGGDVRYLAERPFNLSGQDLTHARAIFSENGTWSLNEQGVLTVEEVHAKKVKAEQEICIQDVCVNRDQLNALLINANISGGSTPAASPTADTTPTTSTPVDPPPTTPTTPTIIPDPVVTPPVLPAEPVVEPPSASVPPADTTPVAP
jgi:hypothetical protein